MFYLALAAVVAVTGGTVHPIAGPAIEQGVLLTEGDKITAVGSTAEVAIPEGAAIVDATGLHVWPALIDAHTELGLREIGTVRGTVDLRESGEMNPNARAEVAVNASSMLLPVTRANGVFLAAAVPSGSLVPGTVATIALDGWTWEEMVRFAPTGLVIAWPQMGPWNRRPSFDDEEEPQKPPKWEEKVAALDAMISEARAYATAREKVPAQGKSRREAKVLDRASDVRWESLRTVVEGTTPVWISAGNATQIRNALDWVEKHGLRMVLLDGGGTASDVFRFADELSRRGIPVITRSIRMPRRPEDPYDTPYAIPAKLHAAGVRIAFGTWEASNVRNLPCEAGRAVAYGLPREAAERALTLGAAEVLGVGTRYGSLEAGKSATFILVQGDLLDGRMNVTRGFLDGRELDLQSHHTELWRKWSARPTSAK